MIIYTYLINVYTFDKSGKQNPCTVEQQQNIFTPSRGNWMERRDFYASWICYNRLLLRYILHNIYREMCLRIENHFSLRIPITCYTLCVCLMKGINKVFMVKGLLYKGFIIDIYFLLILRNLEFILLENVAQEKLFCFYSPNNLV